MARLIPSFMDESTPPGERDIFNMLATGPDEWVTLHSLDLAPWNRGLRTEIDFIIIVPDTGILCVEVKSHDYITFDGNRWMPETISRSPFKQASDGRHAFYRSLSELAPGLKHIPIVHCCIFPRAVFDLKPNISIQPWELMDSRDFRAFKSGDKFCAALKIKMQRSIETDGRVKALNRKLSESQIETILRCCVPIQRRRPDAREEIRRREDEIEKILLQQQKPILQLSELNKRLVVSGPAGTGKTLMAMEVARRAADRGQRVALLCFNQLVGDWISKKIEEIEPALPNFVVGRAIRVLAEMAGIQIPDSPSRDYWETELPNQLEDRLTDPDFKFEAMFDYLVLDEAQDVLARPHLWQCLVQLMNKGLEMGSFAIFGDFDFQVLANRAAMQQALATIESVSRPAWWKLSENCRNYRIVGDTAVRLAGIRGPIYSNYLRPGGGVHNYNIAFYDNDETQMVMLSHWLEEFRGQGYKSSEITILSFRADQMSAAEKMKYKGFRLRPAWQAPDCTGYTTIHAFKGMENKVVILTDVVLDDQLFHRDLFYIGMTRGIEIVRVLCSNSSQATLTKWLSEGNGA